MTKITYASYGTPLCVIDLIVAVTNTDQPLGKYDSINIHTWLGKHLWVQLSGCQIKKILRCFKHSTT